MLALPHRVLHPRPANGMMSTHHGLAASRAAPGRLRSVHHLFTPEGMRAAHERVANLYARADRPDARMQREAFS